jgi:hypothetical protein
VAPDDTADESFLSFGKQAHDRVKSSAEHRAFHPEFFITAAETEAAAKRGEPGASVRVHFAVNYTDDENYICVPRVTVKENGKFRSYTSSGTDCAIAAAGIPVSNRPCYLVVDHRQFKRKDGSISQDEVKLWMPPPATAGIMQNAMVNLAENLGIEIPDLDVTRYEAKITKVGTGRQTTWAIDFIARERPMAQSALDKIDKFLEGGYRQTMARILAPSPKYMISKGGRFTKPADYDREREQTSEDAPY